MNDPLYDFMMAGVARARMHRGLGSSRWWVDNAYSRTWERIEARLGPDWLPIEEPRRRAPYFYDYGYTAEGFARDYAPLPKHIVTEMGCGSYGCTSATEDVDVVVKITSDPTEAIFVANALKMGRSVGWPQGIVRYYSIYKIPRIRVWHWYWEQNMPIYLLWREVVDDPALNDLEYDYETDVFDFREDLEALKQVGNDMIYVLKDLSPQEQMKIKQMAVNILAESAPPGYRLPPTVVRDPTPALVAGAENMAGLVRVFREYAESMVENEISTPVKHTLLFYLERGLILGDVHPGNVGVGGDGIVKIFDPGHAFAMTKKLERVKIPSL